MKSNTSEENFRLINGSLFEKRSDEFGRGYYLHVYLPKSRNKKAAIDEYLQACEEEEENI